MFSFLYVFEGHCKEKICGRLTHSTACASMPGSTGAPSNHREGHHGPEARTPARSDREGGDREGAPGGDREGGDGAGPAPGGGEGGHCAGASARM